MSKPKQEVVVGFFVVMAFIILSMIVFFISGVYLFRPGYHLAAHFDYVGIINKGAPVRMSGVRIGEVSEIRIEDSQIKGEKDQVAITFFVEKGVQIREGYRVEVRGTHIMSEPHLEITPVPNAGEVLENGDVMKNARSPVSTDEMIRRFDESAKKIENMFSLFDEFIEVEENRQALVDSLTNMNQMLASMNEIVVGNEEQFRSMVVNMNEVAVQTTSLLERLNQGEGVVGKLLTEDEIYYDLRDLVKDLKKHPWRLLKKS